MHIEGLHSKPLKQKITELLDRPFEQVLYFFRSNKQLANRSFPDRWIVKLDIQQMWFWLKV